MFNFVQSFVECKVSLADGTFYFIQRFQRVPTKE